MITNLKQMLENTARQYGDKTAIVSGERRVSYSELDESSNKVANALMKMGVNKGDRVIILLPDTPDSIIVYFGVMKCGGGAVRLNPRSKIEEVTPFFEDCQPKVLITESSALETLMPILPNFKSIEKVIDLSGKHNEGQFVSYQEIMNTASPQRTEVETKIDDVVDIAYTSGTTGIPKGIMLSNDTLITGVNVIAKGFLQNEKDINLLFGLPLYHMFALAAVILISVHKGSTVVMVPGLSIDSLFEAIEKEKATVLVGVPAIYGLAIEKGEKEGVQHDLSSIRFFGSAGAPLPVESIKSFKKLYGTDIIGFYGTSESPAIYTIQPVDGTGKIGSIGKIHPDLALKIIDDAGKELSQNQAGEIILKGCMMVGYYKKPQATDEVIKDGWYYTSDIGKVDEDGYVFILGRKKDMIIVSGHNVYPVDVEDVLHTNPKVAEAAVIGVPDKARGEALKAFVTLKKGESATEAEIKKFCRERLVDYKVPKTAVILDAMPKTGTGKIRKQDLREKY